MPQLPEFRLEAFFTRWEFTAKYHLTASDAETLGLQELLALADDEMRARWNDLRLSYTETFGTQALRQAIAATYERVTPEDVICFAGAEEGLYIAMQILLERGDHAIVMTPNYQSAETVPLSICEVTGVALREDRDWEIDLDAVRASIRPETKVISVNAPNNPTGAVPSRETWAQLIALCEERGIVLFSDEVYRGLEQPPNQPLVQAADASASALSLNVMSKAYGLPGLRIGWIACRDGEVIRRLERAKQYTSLCNSAPSELLAVIALRARSRIVERNRANVAHNVQLCDQFFGAYAELYDWKPPQGGCVCFPAYHGADGVEAMCESLVREEGILLLPASIYRSGLTPTPQNRFRIGLGRSPAIMREALEVWSRRLQRSGVRP